MLNLEKVQGDNMPQTIEYLGNKEWAVRWDIEEFSETTDMGTINGYKYYELKFNKKPEYGDVVTALIRLKYTENEEDALKSNMVEQLHSGVSVQALDDEWKAFQTYRNEAKIIGRQLFNTESNIETW